MNYFKSDLLTVGKLLDSCMGNTATSDNDLIKLGEQFYKFMNYGTTNDDKLAFHNKVKVMLVNKNFGAGADVIKFLLWYGQNVDSVVTTSVTVRDTSAVCTVNVCSFKENSDKKLPKYVDATVQKYGLSQFIVIDNLISCFNEGGEELLSCLSSFEVPILLRLKFGMYGSTKFANQINKDNQYFDRLHEYFSKLGFIDITNDIGESTISPVMLFNPKVNDVIISPEARRRSDIFKKKVEDIKQDPEGFLRGIEGNGKFL